MENKASSPPATTIVIWTPQASTTAPHPMAASGCTPMVTMLNSPRMADLRSGGDRSCTADEEVTKREEVAKPAKKETEGLHFHHRDGACHAQCASHPQGA